MHTTVGPTSLLSSLNCDQLTWYCSELDGPLQENIAYLQNAQILCHHLYLPNENAFEQIGISHLSPLLLFWHLD